MEKKINVKKIKEKFLFILLFSVIVKQIVWSAFVPLWHFPDEQAHFAQLQNIVEIGTTAPQVPHSTSREIYESEKLLGTDRDWQGNNQFTHRPTYKLEYVNSIEGLHEITIIGFPSAYRKELVIREATYYPPLYYQSAALVYKMTQDKNLLTRAFTVRVFNLLLFLGIVYLTYELTKKLFPARPLFCYTVTLLVAFHPMFSFLSAGINSDNLFNFTVALALVHGVFILSRGWRAIDILVMLGIVLMALMSKPQGKLLPLNYIYPLFFITTRNRSVKVTVWIGVFTIGFFALAPFIQGLVTGAQYAPDIRADISLYKIFTASFLEHIRWTLIHTYREVIPWYWGVYRWLSLTYPRLIHRTINWITVLSIFGLFFYFYKLIRKQAVVVEAKYVFFLLYVCGIYFMGLTIFDFLFRQSNQFSFGIQGRYYFPVILAHMSLLFIGWVTLIQVIKYSEKWIKLFGMSMVLLGWYAWFFVISSYYNITSLRLFFQEASQYKPIFFKSPFLEVYVVLSFVLTLILVWYYLSYESKKSQT